MSGSPYTVLHYVGYDDDRGGIVSIVRALATANRFTCVLGVNPGFRPQRTPVLATLELPALTGERLGFRTFWRARVVAAAARQWLRGDRNRIFHGHSRAGLAVALDLIAAGETRVVASVHCYGRQRWYYRRAARRLGSRLFWLTPAMKAYYGVGPNRDEWEQCIPGCMQMGLPPCRSIAARPAGIVRLGGVGALVPWKRWDLVLTSLARLSPAVREKLRFAHIGNATDTPEARRQAVTLRNKTEALGLENIVEWRGEEPSSQALLSEIDCLIVASELEPFSVSMLESLAAGVPVLAANSGGARDIIQPPRNGWLFRSGDPGDLARALSELVERGSLPAARINPDDIRRYSAPVIAARWADVYARLASGLG